MSSSDIEQPRHPPRPTGDRLDSWKEIAAYLKRDVSTVQRWEKRESLPVHRHVHDKLGTVYGYRSELDEWWNNRHPRLEPVAVRRPLWFRAAVGAGLAVAFLAIGYSAARVIGRRPLSTGSHDMVVRRVWSGPDADRYGSVSPDGRYIAYSDPRTEDLAVYDITAGSERRLTSRPTRARTGGARFPTISHDGKQIAYGWDQAFFQELRVIRVDGSGERTLFQDPDIVTLFVYDWMPDNRYILAVFGRRDRTAQMLLVSVADGSVRVLKNLDWRLPMRASFSRDGRYVAYDLQPRGDSQNRDIFVLAVADGRERRLIEHPANDFLLGWAPDGKTILFSSDRGGTIDAWMIPVRDGAPQGAPVLVKREIGRAWPLGFTQAGSFHYGLEAGNKHEVYSAAIDPATGQVLAAAAAAAQQRVGLNQSPDWSPDGRLIAYISQQTNGLRWPAYTLVVQEVDPGQRREFELKLEFTDTLRWAADGRSLLITGYSSEGRTAVLRVDAQTGELTPLVESTDPLYFFHGAATSSDGRNLFYKIRDRGVEPARLMMRDLRSSQEKEFLGSVYRFDLSRNGKSLAFCSFDEKTEFIAVAPAAGGAPRELYREPRSGRINSIAWTPDGKYLLFTKTGNLWRISAQGGKPEMLPVAMESMRELRVHPDGKRITFTGGKARGEVWAMERFLPVS